MDFKETELKPADLIRLALNWCTFRFHVNRVIDLLILQNAVYLLVNLPTIKFSRKALLYGDSFVTECNAYRELNVRVIEC
jgi:hypothetical protein